MRSVIRGTAASASTFTAQRASPRTAGSVGGCETAHLHRTATGRDLRPAPGGRPAVGGARLRRLLPIRPLSQHGRDARSGLDRRVAHARRTRPRNVARSASARSSRPSRSVCPGPLAIEVAQADVMSGGRIELGLGAGWYGDEHAAYGIPFPPTGDALRDARRAALDHRRTVDHTDRRDLLVRGQATTRSRTRRRSRSRRNGRDRRSSSAVGHRSARRAWPRSSRTSSTCRSAPVSDFREASRSRARRVREDRPRSRLDEVHRRAASCASARPKPSSRRRAKAIGQRPRGAARARRRGHAGRSGRVHQVVRARPAPRPCTCRCSTSTTSTTCG